MSSSMQSVPSQQKPAENSPKTEQKPGQPQQGQQQDRDVDKKERQAQEGGK